MTSSIDRQSVSADAAMKVFVEAATVAGDLIMRSFGGELDFESKSDASPVTESDTAAEAMILGRLAEAFPGVPLVAEEAIAGGHVPPDLGRHFFLIDPLDGTKEFVAGLPDFTVNIALVEAGRPLCGVVYAPAYGELYVGSAKGAFRRRRHVDGSYGDPVRISARQRPARPLALASRSHRTIETNRYLERLPLEAIVPVGSSLKFCRIAEGAADLYPCLGRTMEWDTAAGHAVLTAAGGHVMRLEGGDLAYGKRAEGGRADFANPHFVATGKVVLPEL